MRVIYLMASGLIGGTERHLSELLPCLAEQGVKPEAWLFGPRGWASDQLEAAGIPVLSERNLATDLFRAVQAERTLIVHSYLYADHVLDAFVLRLTGTRYVKSTRNQGGWNKHSLGSLARVALRRRLVRYHLVNSTEVKRYLVHREGVDPARISVIYNGIRDRSHEGPRIDRTALGFADTHFVFTVVSRLRPHKNVGFLIRAVAGLQQLFPQVRLLIVGDGAERQTLERLAWECVPHGVVRFVGFHPAPHALLRLSDVFVTASNSEGMSNALIEAAMMGLPALVSRGAAGEVVTEGRTGLVFDPNLPGEFISAATRLINDSGFRTALGQAARQRYTHLFTLERQVQLFVEYYAYVAIGSTGAAPFLSDAGMTSERLNANETVRGR